MLCASKFDELDYNLPPSSLILQLMHCSPYVSHYDNSFDVEDMKCCEKNICNRLSWNFHQYTPYHFMQVLFDQGTSSDKDVVVKSCEEKGGLHQDPNSSIDSTILTSGLSNNLAHQSTGTSSGNTSHVMSPGSFKKIGFSSRKRLGTEDNMESDTTQ